MLSDFAIWALVSFTIEHCVRGTSLLELDHYALKEMGINSLADRIRILTSVKTLRVRCLAVHHPYSQNGHHNNGQLSGNNSNNSSSISNGNGHGSSVSSYYNKVST